jgi:hypothetical protein
MVLVVGLTFADIGGDVGVDGPDRVTDDPGGRVARAAKRHRERGLRLGQERAG